MRDALLQYGEIHTTTTTTTSTCTPHTHIHTHTRGALTHKELDLTLCTINICTSYVGMPFF